MQPFFSVITVSFNAEKWIGRTLRSVLEQICGDFEIIVQDGDSSDDTLNQIPRDAHIRVFSEPDAGIYDAMNKAVNRAKGRYCIFMNCGDTFATNRVLADLKSELITLGESSVLYGDYESDGVLYRQPHLLSAFYLYRTPLCHQSMVFARELFARMGGYDCTYRILADYDWTLNCFRAGIPFVHSRTLVCNYLGGGVSESRHGMRLKSAERRRILRRYYGRADRLRYDLILALTLRRFRVWLFSGRSPRWLTRLYRSTVNIING